jgi:hypothetical protein
MAYIAPSITTSGATFANLQADGLSGVLEKLIAAQAATAAPTAAPTASAAGGGSSGGLLAAGTYLLKFTETNGLGETTASPELASAITVAAGNIPQVTFPSLQTGNVARDLYATPANGASGTEVLYATGITTTTYNMAAAAKTNSFAVPPPAVNTTGLSYTDANGRVLNTPLVLLRAAKDGNLDDVYRYAAQVVRTFLEGEPVPWLPLVQKFKHAHAAVAALNQVLTDVGTLLDANAGTLGIARTGIGAQKQVRTWR